VTLTAAFSFSQETTGGLQGTIKDPSGAVVAKASLELTGSSLVGSKKLETDNRGYYRFANLLPGNYVLAVSAQDSLRSSAKTSRLKSDVFPRWT